MQSCCNLCTCVLCVCEGCSSGGKIRENCEKQPALQNSLYVGKGAKRERERKEGGKSVENAAVGFGGGKPLGIDSATTFNRITPANG